jgi:hypothetical protein
MTPHPNLREVLIELASQGATAITVENEALDRHGLLFTVYYTPEEEPLPDGGRPSFDRVYVGGRLLAAHVERTVVPASQENSGPQAKNHQTLVYAEREVPVSKGITRIEDRVANLRCDLPSDGLP